jgi:hypothetical protein
MKSLQPLAVALAAGTFLAFTAAARADDLPTTATSEPAGPPITATLDTVPGSFPANSFFDVFVEITLPGPNITVVDGFEFSPPTNQTPSGIDLNSGGQPIIIDDIFIVNEPASLPISSLTISTDDSRFTPTIQGFSVDVPEPGALLIIGGGLLAIGAARRATRRRK